MAKHTRLSEMFGAPKTPEAPQPVKQTASTPTKHSVVIWRVGPARYSVAYKTEKDGVVTETVVRSAAELTIARGDAMRTLRQKLFLPKD